MSGNNYTYDHLTADELIELDEMVNELRALWGLKPLREVAL